MLKKSASGVLATLKGSTLRGTPWIFEILKGLIRSPRPFARANGYTKCGPYLLASSLAAALRDGLFEHPAVILKSAPYGRFQWWFMNKPSFPQPVRRPEGAKPALFMNLLLQARIRCCDRQSRRSALRHTVRVASAFHVSECLSRVTSARFRNEPS